MGRLHRMIVWLSRIHRCRGFGIQSPWAYSFVCQVINGRYPYYGYAEAEGESHGLDPLERKLGRLYLRLANHVKAAFIVNAGTGQEASGRYLRAGSRYATVQNLSSDATAEELLRLTEGVTAVDIVRLAPGCDARGLLKAALLKAREGTIIVLEGIKRDPAMRLLWRDVVQNAAGTVTFDLYYCGLVCVKPKLFKRNYMVNFWPRND